MGKKKKFWIMISALVLAVTVAGTAVAFLLLGDGQGVAGDASKLPTLPDTSEEVVLGTAYETATTLMAKDGTVYTVEQVEVYRNSNGKQVVQIYGVFDVTDVLGYKIVYTAVCGEARVTQTHTLYVRDEGKPLIAVSGSHVAEVGAKYLFPNITIRDNSGEELAYAVEVYKSGDAPVKAAQETDGFVPDAVGEYELRISAADAAGNRTDATYTVYARHTRLTTEIDAFDDEGLFYTAYSQSGNQKLQAELSAFARLESSKGSAYFKAGAGDTTAFYMAPRNDISAMNQVGEDGYISIWLYIATLRDSTKTVRLGDTDLTVNTNIWQELRITREIIGPWPAFISKLESYSVPLLQVVNDGEDYTVFIDDVFAVQNNVITIGGLTETKTYAPGNAVSVQISGGQDVVCEYYQAGEAVAFTGSFTPENEGEYLITAYNKNRMALSSQVVTIGELKSEVRTTQWYVKGEEFPVPELNAYYADQKIEAETITWLVDMQTGEKAVLGNTFVAEDDLIGLYSETTFEGKKTALLRILSMNDTSFGTWFVTDDPQCAVKPFVSGSLNLSWLEEYDGEQGVVKIDNTTGKEAFFSQRNFWKVPYAKDHYKRCTKLVFKIKTDLEGVRLSYIAEQSWNAKMVSEKFSDEWQEYIIDFADIYANFTDFTANHMFWTDSFAQTPYTIYIADIYAVVENELDTVTVHQGTTYDVAANPAFEGCEITEIQVTKQGYSVGVNGTAFTASGSGMYKVQVCGYDHMGLYFENTFSVNSVSPDTWYDFGDPACAEIWKNGGTLTWLESYAGAEGVLKIENDKEEKILGNTNGINWPAAYEQSHYRNVVGLSFRIRVEGNAANTISVYGKDWKQNFGRVMGDQKATDGWQEFLLKVDVYKNYDLLNGMFLTFWSNGATAVYIDEITVIEGKSVNEPNNMWHSFSDPFGAAVWKNGGKLTWLEDYDGASGVLKIENDKDEKIIGADNAINWEAAFGKSHYNNAIGLSFRIKVEGDALTTIGVYGKEWKANYGRVMGDHPATDGWQEFLVKVDVAENYDLLNGLFLTVWSNGPSTIYIDQITVVEMAGEAAQEPDNMWHSFSDPFGAAVWTNGAKLSWLESYENATGVLKISKAASGENIVGADNFINWEAAFDKENYQNAIGLTFRVKIEGDALNTMGIYGRNWGKVFGKVYNDRAATDGWQEFTVYTDVYEDYDLLNGMFLTFWSNGASDVYIDQITVIEGSNVEEPDDMWHSFSDASGAAVWSNGGTLTWLESYEDAYGVLKIEKASGGEIIIGDTNGINWPAVFGAEHYGNVGELIFRVKLEGDGLNAVAVWGRNYGWNQKIVQDGGATDGWVDISVNVEGKTYDSMNGMWISFWSNSASTLYIDQITVVEKTEEEPEPTEPEPTEPDVTEPEETQPDATEPDDMWYSFSDPASASVWTNGATLTWLNSYEGASGVLKIEKTAGGENYIGSDNGINWPAAFGADHYAGATALRFRIKIEGNAFNALTVYKKGFVGSYGKLFNDQLATNGWQEFVLNVSVAQDYELLNGMFLILWTNGPSTVYIDQITVVMEEEPEPTEPDATEPEETQPDATEPDDMWYSFSDPASASVWTNGATLTWLNSYEGASGVLKIEKAAGGENYIGSDNGINWPAAFGADHYAGATALRFRIKIEGSAFNALTLWGKGGVPYGKVFNDQLATNGWQEFTFNLDVAEKYDLLNGLFLTLWTNGPSTVYIDQITVGFEEEPEPTEPDATEPEETQPDATEPDDMWYSFSDPASASVWTNGATLSWLESYEDSNGILKIEKSTAGDKYIGATDGVNWPAAHAEAEYTDVTALTFRVKIEGSALNSLTMWGMNGTWRKTVFQDAAATDGWMEFTVPVNIGEQFESLNGIHLTFWSNGPSTIYIDQITVVREAKNLWYDFSDSACANVWASSSKLKRSWLESYDGAQGVLKLEETAGNGTRFFGNTNGINWPAAMTAEEASDVTGLTFRVKIEGNALNTITVFGKGGAWNAKLFQDIGATDGWVEFTIPVNGATQYETMNGLYLTIWSNGPSVIYIDEITAVKKDPA